MRARVGMGANGIKDNGHIGTPVNFMTDTND